MHIATGPHHGAQKDTSVGTAHHTRYTSPLRSTSTRQVCKEFSVFFVSTLPKCMSTTIAVAEAGACPAATSQRSRAGIWGHQLARMKFQDYVACVFHAPSRSIRDGMKASDGVPGSMRAQVGHLMPAHRQHAYAPGDSTTTSRKLASVTSAAAMRARGPRSNRNALRTSSTVSGRHRMRALSRCPHGTLRPKHKDETCRTRRAISPHEADPCWT